MEVKVKLYKDYLKSLNTKENRELMDTLAEFLIEKETITGKEFMKIFREAKGIPEPEEKPVKNVQEAEASVEEKTDTEAVSEEPSIEEETVSTPSVPEDEVCDEQPKESSKENVGIFSGRNLDNE